MKKYTTHGAFDPDEPSPFKDEFYQNPDGIGMHPPILPKHGYPRGIPYTPPDEAPPLDPTPEQTLRVFGSPEAPLHGEITPETHPDIPGGWFHPTLEHPHPPPDETTEDTPEGRQALWDRCWAERQALKAEIVLPGVTEELDTLFRGFRTLIDEAPDCLFLPGAFLTYGPLAHNPLYRAQMDSLLRGVFRSPKTFFDACEQACPAPGKKKRAPHRETHPGASEDQDPLLPLLALPNGLPRTILQNIVTVLQEPVWQGVFGLNQLTGTPMVRRPMPGAGYDILPRELRDADDAEVCCWLQTNRHLFVSVAMTHEGINLAAQSNAYHPVQEYLRKLEWDRVPRLDTWLSTYAAAEDSVYTREVARCTLIAAVARAFRPGCQVDTVTILKGAQGMRKSSTWRVLAEPWFSDSLGSLQTNAAAESLRGVWILEIGELSALGRSDQEVIKRFISATQDHYRPSYGRRALNFPRQNIFVGSTNRDDFLKDETGNRRYWTIETHGMCDTDALANDRDQLWAEAMWRYLSDEPWYMTFSQELDAMKRQEAYVEQDSWGEAIEAWVLGKHDVTIAEVLSEALKIDLGKHDLALQRRVGKILRLLGWKYMCFRRRTDDGISIFVKGFKPPRVVTGTLRPRSGTYQTNEEDVTNRGSGPDESQDMDESQDLPF